MKKGINFSRENKIIMHRSYLLVIKRELLFKN